MGGIQDFLVQQVKNAVLSHTGQQNTGFDPSALIQQISTAATQGNLDPSTITGMIQNHASNQQHTGFDPGPLLSQVQGLFGQHQAAQQGGTSQFGTAGSSGEDADPGPADEQSDNNNGRSSDAGSVGDGDDEQGGASAKSSDEDTDADTDGANQNKRR